MIPISIIIPAFNEELYLERAIDTILISVETTKCDYELIIIDDGSTDKTSTISRSFSSKNPRIKSIRLEKNYGRGHAIDHGFSIAQKEFITVFNGKGDISSQEIVKLLNTNISADILLTFQLNKSERSFIRKILSVIYTSIYNFSFNQNIKYYNGSFIIRRSLYMKNRVRNSSYAFEVEFIISFLARKIYTYQELGIFDIYHNNRSTRSFTIKNIYLVIKTYFYLVFKYHRFFSKRQVLDAKT